MHASIVHMLIAREVLRTLKSDAAHDGLPFVAELAKHETSMTLGSLGPDLGRSPRSKWNEMLDKLDDYLAKAQADSKPK